MHIPKRDAIELPVMAPVCLARQPCGDQSLCQNGSALALFPSLESNARDAFCLCWEPSAHWFVSAVPRILAPAQRMLLV